MRRFLTVIIFVTLLYVTQADIFLIYMDNNQKDHLKSYGVVYSLVEKNHEVNWLLNYRGGSFVVQGGSEIKAILEKSGISFEKIDSVKYAAIDDFIENSNCDKVLINKATKIAVYTPDTANPWDDAVTMALEYANIPYTKIYDKEILSGALEKFDWLHLHHEDFTGQLGKFYGVYSNADWYRTKLDVELKRAKALGFNNIPELKKNVALKIREYVENGGFLFAMCAATDTIDIALSTLNTDVVAQEIDGTPVDQYYKSKIDFNMSFAFENFKLETNPYIYEFSDIDIEAQNSYTNIKTFKLFEFAAKYDKTAAILTQNHTRIIADFLGQTTAYKKQFLKKDVLVLGFLNENEAKYIHGIRGKGTFTFLAGHDPEDYAHIVGESPTDLKFHKNSPGYRLILNNVLFPSVKKKKLKT